MSPDDPRHGTVAGYNRIPCRQPCCKLALARYRKRLEYDLLLGKPRRIPMAGSRRRVEALAAIGWPKAIIARACGWHETNLVRLTQQAMITTRMADRIAAVYDDLHMTPGPSRRAKIRAARKGYLPPLAWDDIDDPNEQPDLTQDHFPDPESIDPVVIERILAGDWKLPANRAERGEVCRRWTGSQNDLARYTGWKVERYYRVNAA